MKTRWLGVAATALAVSAGPACASAGGSLSSAAIDGPPKLNRAAALTASAWAALARGDAVQAVEDAEAAALLLPNDAGSRLLLGRAYLAAGRFGSSESAFSDALTLDPAMTRAAISRSLAQIALGKTDAARTSLALAEGSAADSDVGLAEALLGDTESALKRLDGAARAPDSDARTRQNLGLVYALEGRWIDAVAIAQQDVPPDLMPGRLRRWAMIAQLKADPAMQIGAILGVLPAEDKGLPAALTLVTPPTPEIPAGRQLSPVMVDAEPVQSVVHLAMVPVAPEIQTDSGSVVTLVNPVPPSLETLMSAPAVMPLLAVPSIDHGELAVASGDELPTGAPSAQITDAPTIMAWAGPPRMRSARPAPARWVEPKLAQRTQQSARPGKASPFVLAATVKPVSSRPVALATTSRLQPSAKKQRGGWAVQVGAYSSVRRTEIAWGRLTGRLGFLSAYAPTGSSRAWGKAMIYRLSVSGLPTRQDAVKLCLRIKAAGGECFVRATHGDRPMQWASRQRAEQAV